MNDKLEITLLDQFISDDRPFFLINVENVNNVVNNFPQINETIMLTHIKKHIFAYINIQEEGFCISKTNQYNSLTEKIDHHKIGKCDNCHSNKPVHIILGIKITNRTTNIIPDKKEQPLEVYPTEINLCLDCQNHILERYHKSVINNSESILSHTI